MGWIHLVQQLDLLNAMKKVRFLLYLVNFVNDWAAVSFVNKRCDVDAAKKADKF